MQTEHTGQKKIGGYGLLIVMAMMAVLLIVFASALSWSYSNSVITTRNNLFNESENAADSETENIIAYMMRDFTSSTLSGASSYSTLSPTTNSWPLYFNFGPTNGDTNAGAGAFASVSIGNTSIAATNLSSEYQGLYGFVLPCTIASTAAPQGQSDNLSATVSQGVQFVIIPLFEFAIFYNMDLEFNPGQGMTINGHVHSNNKIWATGSGGGGSALTFNNYVDAASGIFLQRSTNDPSPARTGNVVFTITNNNPVANSSVLSLPIGGTTLNNNPTNVLALLDPAPAAYAPPNYSAMYSGNGTHYFQNLADLVVSNTAFGTNGMAIVNTNGVATTNIFAYYQNPNNSPNYLLFVQPDMMITNSYSTNNTTGTVYTNTTSYYSFLTNASFYDYRESDQVRALQIDVTNLDLWLANTNKYTNAMGIFSYGGYYNALRTNGPTQISLSQGICSIYVNNAVPHTTGQLPAVRVVHGQRLPPSGLTVVTPEPVYVMGSYNTTTDGVNFSTSLGMTAYTRPSSLIGDALTVLSSSWNDSYNFLTSINSRGTVTTTINTATMEGIVPSNGTTYSGGVENFMRLQENWSGVTLTYNGSIVVMFPSQVATNGWPGTSIVYNPPNRNWGFDTNFNSAASLPPLVPEIKGTIRSGWAAW